MKHLKKFEFFSQKEENDEKDPFAEELMPNEPEVNYLEEEEEECATCSTEEENDEKDWNDDNSDTIKVEGFRSFNEKKKLTKTQEEELDKNKNGIIDEKDFEILRKEKKADAKKDSSEKEEGKGLTDAQKKLPDALKASILKKKAKK